MDNKKNNYKQKYYKYKHKYMKLKHGGEEKRNVSFSHDQEEIDYIDERIDYFLHDTPLKNFIKIMKEMLLKPNRPNFGVVFASIVLKQKDNIGIYEPKRWGDGEYIDKNILFDKDIYYFINPSGEYGYYNPDSIPGPNFKEILKHKNWEKYIKSLKIEEYIKSNMLYHWTQIYPEDSLGIESKQSRDTVKNTISGLESEIFKDGQLYGLNEICFFNNIDLKKYMTGVYLNKKIYKEIKKIIPTGIKIYQTT